MSPFAREWLHCPSVIVVSTPIERRHKCSKPKSAQINIYTAIRLADVFVLGGSPAGAWAALAAAERGANRGKGFLRTGGATAADNAAPIHTARQTRPHGRQQSSGDLRSPTVSPTGIGSNGLSMKIAVAQCARRLGANPYPNDLHGPADPDHRPRSRWLVRSGRYTVERIIAQPLRLRGLD